MRTRLAIAVTAVLAAGAVPFVVAATVQDGRPAPAPGAAPDDDTRRAAIDRLLASLAAEGVHLDLAAGHVAVGAQVLMRDQLIEHVLVGPGGASHEALFSTEVTPSLLNAAVLALGTAPGRNASWHLREAPPAETPPPAGEAPPAEQDRPGDGRGDDRPEYRIEPPSGDGLYLHAGWREGDEVYFFRVEDLIANLETGRSMPRHRLVYLGSRLAVIPGMPPELSGAEPGEPPREVFVADFERNLVNLIYFADGNTLFTCVHGDTNRQDIWAANIWNLPEMQEPVLLVFSRTPLEACPPSLRARLPEAKRPDAPR
jgi:hypothetical protein